MIICGRRRLRCCETSGRLSLQLRDVPPHVRAALVAEALVLGASVAHSENDSVVGVEQVGSTNTRMALFTTRYERVASTGATCTP